MRQLNFQDGFTSSSAPTQGLVSSTALLSFPDDASFVTFKGAAAAAPDIYFNSTFGLPKFYDGTNWQFFNGDAIALTSFTLANNQSSPANVTGLSFDGSKVRSAKIRYEIYRNTTSTGATELGEQGWIDVNFKTVANGWTISQASDGDEAGITFTITSAGQVQYTSTNITGTAASSYMKFSARTLPI